VFEDTCHSLAVEIDEAMVIAYVWDYPQSGQSAPCHLPLRSADGCLSFISIVFTFGLADFATAEGVATSFKALVVLLGDTEAEIV
jgi:hypothetical protein